MALQDLTKKHNKTDFMRLTELEDMRQSLEEARATIKSISEKATKELMRYTKNTKGYAELAEKHNNLVDKYGAKKKQVYDKVEEVRALQA